MEWKKAGNLLPGDVFQWYEQDFIFISSFVNNNKSEKQRFIICRVQKQKIRRCRDFSEKCDNHNCWHCRRLIVVDKDACSVLVSSSCYA